MVGFLIVGTTKLMVWMFRLSIWLVWALLVLAVALIASATGNERTSRSWMRSLPRVPLP
jgi:hypothetical protein